MARISCITLSATYQGALELRSTSGHQMRLLDALNTPQRLQQPVSLGENSLFFESGVRKTHRSGHVESFHALSLRVGLLLAAYELALDAESEEQRAAAMKGATLYEQRSLATAQEPVTIYLRNGWRVQGHVTPSRQVLHESRTGRHFVPVLDVTIDEPGAQSARRFPFLAVNVVKIEGVGE